MLGRVTSDTFGVLMADMPGAVISLANLRPQNGSRLAFVCLYRLGSQSSSVLVGDHSCLIAFARSF